MTTMAKKKRASGPERAERAGSRSLEEMAKYAESAKVIAGTFAATFKMMKETTKEAPDAEPLEKISFDGINRADRALELLFAYADDFANAVKRERRKRGIIDPQ
jgi:hypothetical protein